MLANRHFCATPRYITMSETWTIGPISTPEGSFLDRTNQRDFRTLRYSKYFALFRLRKFDQKDVRKPGFFLDRRNDKGAPAMQVIQRDSTRPHLARLQSIHVTRGELFYLRSLLLSRPGISWKDLQTIDGALHPSFQAACIALGLFADKNEAKVCTQEAVDTLSMPEQLRFLFVHLLTNFVHRCPPPVLGRVPVQHF